MLTRLPTTTFAFVSLVSVACLIWMLAVTQRITREAGPRIAEELDEAEPVPIPDGSE